MALRFKICLPHFYKYHKVLTDLVERGKTSTGWFFGYKVHLVCNDRKPVLHLFEKLFGKIFGDKGYLSQALFEQLMAQVKHEEPYDATHGSFEDS